MGRSELEIGAEPFSACLLPFPLNRAELDTHTEAPQAVDSKCNLFHMQGHRENKHPNCTLRTDLLKGTHFATVTL